MTRLTDEKALELLRGAMAPPAVGDTVPDLWPRVRRRIDRGPGAPPVADWLLALLLAVLCLAQPSLVGILLLHF